MSEEVKSCRSESGQTVGLVDAVIHVVRAADERDLTHPDVQNALVDLYQDPPFQAFLIAAKAASDAYMAAERAANN